MNSITRLLLAVCGATLLTGTCWLAASTSHFPLTRIDLDEGQRVFRDRCASCHSVDRSRTSMGPNLCEIGDASDRRKPGLSAEAYLLESIVRPEAFRPAGAHGVMPADIAAGLKPRQVASLVGYLMTHGSTPKTRRLVRMVDRIQVREAQASREIDFPKVDAGKSLYLGKAGCVKCHSLQALPGHDLRAPSLLSAGHHEPAYLRESICEPSRTLPEAHTRWQVWLTSGQVVTGRLISDKADFIELLSDEPGQGLLRVPRRKIEIDDDDRHLIVRQQQSPMPAGLRQTLTDAEIDQIVEFLRTLRYQ